MMNIYTYLKKDHQSVNQLFLDIMAAKSRKQREVLFSELKTQLSLHMESEQKTFYKTLKSESETKGEILHANKEHNLVYEVIAQMDDVEINSELWLMLFGQLKYMVLHHIAEEEKMIFKDAKKILSKDQANELTIKMEKLKERLSQ
jgi:hemerythrin superfamily protein